MKIPQELIDKWGLKLAKITWKEYGRNDKERWIKYNAELEHEAKRRRERAESKRQEGLKHRDEIKYEAFKHYCSGGIIKCARCEFNDIRALTLHGEGRDVPASVHGGSGLYEWLKAHGWPKGYRVLCENHLFIETGRGSTYPLKIEVLKRYPLPEDGVLRYVCPKCGHVNFVPEAIKCPKCHEPLLNQVQCVRCGFSDMRALSLDHVEGGGRKHMEELGIKKASEWYQWLKDNYYPEKPKLQLLCMNCQKIKNDETHEWS